MQLEYRDSFGVEVESLGKGLCRGMLAMVAGLLLAGCGPDGPLRVGFVGGLSDQNSDVGQAGYNGVLLAVEQVNRAGGIKGRKIEVVARDDAQDRETAARSVFGPTMPWCIRSSTDLLGAGSAHATQPSR